MCELIGNGLFADVCERLIPQLLDAVFDWITRVEQGVQPEKLCRFLHACHDQLTINSTQTSTALP